MAVVEKESELPFSSSPHQKETTLVEDAPKCMGGALQSVYDNKLEYVIRLVCAGIWVTP